jgi:hypothetical protein
VCNERRDFASSILSKAILFRANSVAGLFSSDGAIDVTIVGNTIALDWRVTGKRAIDMQPQPASKGGAHFTQIEITKNVIQEGVGIDLREDREGTLGFRGCPSSLAIRCREFPLQELKCSVPLMPSS